MINSKNTFEKQTIIFKRPSKLFRILNDTHYEKNVNTRLLF